MKKKIRILSLDGGGIRGIITCVILKYIEEQIQRFDHPEAKLGDYFDLVAGSSTGGLLASILLFPGKEGKARFSVQEALDLYAKNGETIFNVSFWEHTLNIFGLFNEKISKRNLEKRLDEVFGNLELKDFTKPCLITSYDIFDRKAKFFSSHEANISLENFFVKDVCRATSAAPTYFEPARIKSLYGQEFTLIDGGVFANNPALCAYAEARKIRFSTILADEEKPDFPSINDMLLVSIGTGEVLKPYSFEKFENAGKIRWIAPLIDILLSANAETVDYHLLKMYESLGKRNRQNYYRLVPQLGKASPEMDNVSAKNIYELIQTGLVFVDKNRETLSEIARKLIKNQ
ncbi:patatin-like phospholipase family protein [Flavobacterium sp. MAH-1]|uniref:Patatin-like phospholipase family protein n=1 Tax=Flavobacterium agri TaxID=2743471 RepID=A0A7Y8Y027_9FLAO|nr:patatin-like phospholipase family protein [Flavobacterium agri]NUY80081.1 patatin-like phospholipase family protein [Flavobacterium agri]NYA70106.1 patatin-like phospholipase family protein [Flavobacterium agri]